MMKNQKRRVTYKITSEWDLGMDMYGYESEAEARAELEANPNLAEVCADNEMTVQDCFDQGLLSISKAR